MTEHPCPLCGAPPRQLEHLNEGWKLCNGCGRMYVLDQDGKTVRWTDTNHAPVRPVPATQA